MSTTLRSLLVLLAATVTFSARAESTPVDTAAMPLVAALDADGDGTLSAEEIDDSPWALTALDTNHDGVISPAERRVPESVGNFAAETEGLNVLLALDANHDGAIAFTEITDAIASLERMDRNGDGELTADELRYI